MTTVTHSERKGTQEYNQAVVQNGTAERSAELSGSETREGTTTRDLSSKSIVSRVSSQKANEGFVVSFRIPIVGRIPASPSSCQ